MLRTVIIQIDAMWTGAIEEQVALSVPAEVDIDAAEEAWFKEGGGDMNSFVQHLEKLGCVKIPVEYHTINYQ